MPMMFDPDDILKANKFVKSQGEIARSSIELIVQHEPPSHRDATFKVKQQSILW